MPIRPQHAASLRRNALSLAALALLAGASQQAAADSATATFHTAAPKQIAIRSNGLQYTVPDVPQQGLGASISVDIDAEVSGTIKSWSAWIEAMAEHGNGWVKWTNDKVGQSYPAFERPKTFGSRVHVHVSHATVQPFAVAWCNKLADDLHKSGLSNQQIFAQDRVFRVAFRAVASAEFTGISGTPAPPEVQTPNFDAGLRVVCKAAGGTHPGLPPVAGGFGAAPEARITGITMEVLHTPNPVSCPSAATVRTTYVSDRAGPFTTRVLAASNKVSAPLRFTMGEADRQGSHYVKVHQVPLTIGAPGDPTRLPPGGAVGGQVGGGGGLASPQPGGGELPPGFHRPGGGAAGGLVSPTDPLLFQDSLWAEVVNAAPGSVARSASAAYLVRCPVLNPGLQPTGGGWAGTPGPVLPGAAPAVLPAGQAAGGARATSIRVMPPQMIFTR